MYTFNRADSSHEDFKKLVLLLDEELAQRDGAEHAFYDQFNKIENINNVCIRNQVIRLSLTTASIKMCQIVSVCKKKLVRIEK